MIKRLIAAVALLCAFTASAQTKTPLVQPHWTFVDSVGAACVGCSVYSYVAGTTTPTPTYTDSTGASQNTNPIVLDTSGSAVIWVGTVNLKLVLKDTSGTTLWTIDNIPANGAGGGVCGPASTIQIANSTVTGFSCDALITINNVAHTINVGGALPANHFNLTNLSPVSSNWTLDVTSPTTAAKSIGGGTAGAGKYIDGGTGQWTTLPSPGAGTVTSVGVSVPSQMTVSGSPVTGAGTIALGVNNTGSGAKLATASTVPADGCATWNTGNVDSTGFPCSVAYPFTGTSGYQKLPSGIILEYGIADSASPSVAVTFPLTFPNAVFAVTFGTGNFNLNASRNVCYIEASAPTTSGFTAKTDASTVHCYWFAIGY